MKILFVILAVLAGMIAAQLVIFGIEALSILLYPLPKGLDMYNEASLNEYINKLPTEAFVIVLLGYALGSFTGGVVSTLVSGRDYYIPPIVVGAILTSAGFSNPGPTWLLILSCFVFIPFAILGFMVSKKK